MNELTRLWAISEQQEVNDALRKLFILQGIPKADKTIDEMSVVFSLELMSKGFHSKHVLSALRELGDADLRTIKLSHIVEAAKKYVEPTILNRVDCDYCFGSGVITMANENKYEFALACKCINGDGVASRGTLRWRGDLNQDGRSGSLSLRFPSILNN